MHNSRSFAIINHHGPPSAIIEPSTMSSLFRINEKYAGHPNQSSRVWLIMNVWKQQPGNKNVRFTMPKMTIMIWESDGHLVLWCDYRSVSLSFGWECPQWLSCVIFIGVERLGTNQFRKIDSGLTTIPSSWSLLTLTITNHYWPLSTTTYNQLPCFV